MIFEKMPLGIFVPKSFSASDFSEAFFVLNFKENNMSNPIEAGNIKPRIQFIADGQQKEFQFFFKIYEPENVKVYIEDIEQTSGYSLSTQDDVQGGIIIFDTAPESGKLVTIYRNLELKRTTNFKEGGPFRSSNVNSEFDYQLSCLEQLEDSIGRTVTFPQYAPTNLNINLPMPDAGKSIIWSNNEDCLVNSDYQFDNVVNLSSQYCNQTAENLQQSNNVLSEILSLKDSVTQTKNDISAMHLQTQNYASQAQNFAHEAATNTLNSLYNQSEQSETFTINLKDGVSIYVTPTIYSNTNIVFNFDAISKTANIITFELYISFSITFYPVTFSGINMSWLNNWTPNLEQDGTHIKMVTFRNKTPGSLNSWVASLEGGF